MAVQNCFSPRNVLALAGLVALCLGVLFPLDAFSSPERPKGAALNLTGAGAAPSAQISLSTGKTQTLTTQADKNGNFSFTGLGYAPGYPLTFKLQISPQKIRGRSFSGNKLSFKIDPIGAYAEVQGSVTKAASVVVNLGGEQSGSAVANEKGYFEVMATSNKKLSKGDGFLIASIVNVQEMCCPRTIVPESPLMISISSVPLPEAAPAAKTEKIKKSRKSQTPLPPIFIPEQSKPPAKKEGAPDTNKPYVPYIIQGSVTHETTIVSEPLRMAVSFPGAMYDATWTGGTMKMSDQIIKNVTNHAKQLGSMMDAQNTLKALRAIQKANLESTRKYQPSTGVCVFGSASTSLAASEARAIANKMAFNEILIDTEKQVKNTAFSKTESEGRAAALADFQRKYCRRIDNNNGLESFCKGLGASDTRFNRDVDYARVFDAPLTVKTNFTDAAKTPVEEDVIALFRNLSVAQVLPAVSKTVFQTDTKSAAAQDLRAAIAAHSVAQNTFADIVGQKSEGSGASSASIKAVIQHLGLSAADAEAHVGSKPSYYAQMEILTKKMYQDPAFIANLYESPENVTRQRAAIKATSLQQGSDLYQSLKRREMLLSALLELKLRQRAAQENQSGSTAD
ncbi:MAG: hypothetical protein KBC88_01070 [Alphaproteobacteria bacterium]|jgi:hypothetical protein|nr:hypothetical protein [Alphaproteobacteria bacterium]MBP9867505.1 hypothetical protein [Alphaproteobacteria bacterium]